MPPTNENPTEFVEDYLDCQGKRRKFRISEIANGHFVVAHELPKGERTGLRFTLATKAGEIPPWGEMRALIRKRLAERSVVHGSDGLALLTNVIRGQLTEADEPQDEFGEREPKVIIDDLEISWTALGRLLRSHIGFGFRLELTEAGEE